MKKVMYTLAIAGLLVACGDSGKKAETGEAKKVEEVKTDKTVTLNKVKDGSHLTWRATHLGGAQPRFGKIFLKEGSVLLNDGKVTNATAIIDMNTLTVENFAAGAPEIEKLRGHLLAGDFFDVEKHPTSKFELTSIDATTGDYNSKVTGNLTIMGKTKSITFNASVKSDDSMLSIDSEKFSVDRSDWGLTYNAEGTAGVPVDYLIADDITFEIDLTMTK